MGLIKAIKSFLDEQVSYEEGYEAGEEYDGDFVNAQVLKQAREQLNPRNLYAFNKGFIDASVDADEEE